MKNKRKQLGMPLWRKYLPIILVLVIGVGISYLIGPDRYYQRILLLIFLWAAASAGFNIISGYGGQVVFGYMMFVGTGAYSTVLLFKFLGVSPWLGMWGGAVIAAIVALIIGLPTLRLHGAYFAVATVAFPLIMGPILNYLGFEEVTIPFTGHGAISMQFTDMRFYVIIAAILLTVTLVIIQTMERTRFGFALRALKQNEAAAESMGIDTFETKLKAFMLSAAVGAIMGAIYAFSILYVVTVHSTLGLFIIVRILSISIVGGLATVWGPVVGAGFLVPIGEFLNAQFGDRYPGVQDIIYGAALIAVIIYLPEGIWGKIRRSLNVQWKFAPSAETRNANGSKQDITDTLEGQGSLRFEPIERKTVENKKHSTILKVEGVYKSFGGVMALGDVNLEVPRGKILGIIGPNGGGKTTLFNVMNGYLEPERGKVFFEGRDTTHFKPHALCKLGVGRTFQVGQIFSSMTVLENIMIGASNRGGNIADIQTIAADIAHQLGLSHRINDYAVGLTLWETKILELSRALATQPKLLLVDEPMGGLNQEERNQIGEILKMTAKSGMTVVVIEHVVQSLVKIADWMVGLEYGRKVAEGTPDEVISDPHIIEAYLGAKWRQRHVNR